MRYRWTAQKRNHRNLRGSRLPQGTVPDTGEVPSGHDLIDNPWYDTCNALCIAVCGAGTSEDAIILDGDQIIYRSILSPEFERSGYNSVWTDGGI